MFSSVVYADASRILFGRCLRWLFNIMKINLVFFNALSIKYNSQMLKISCNNPDVQVCHVRYSVAHRPLCELRMSHLDLGSGC